MNTLLQDFRYAIRQLMQQRAFSAVAVLALALGIGGNTAIFTVINAILLKPLAFPRPEQLVVVGGWDKRNSDNPTTLNTLSFPEFFDLRARNRSFAQLAAYRDKGFAFVDGAQVQNLRGQRVTGNFFALLQITPVLGRAFDLVDEQAGGGPRGLSVILSDEFWRRQFNADPNVLGRPLILDRQPFTVVGVMPREFQFPVQAEPIDVYVTTAIDAVAVGGQPPQTEQRNNRQVRIVGRLRDHITADQASAEMHALAGVLAQEQPLTNTNWDLLVRPLRDYLVANVRLALWVLSGAVVCVLLIASVNVANLLLARASARTREIALRMALGATRARVIRQLLTESLLLASIGGAFGLILALWGTQALIAIVPKAIPRAANIQLDAPVLAFTIAVSFATGVIFGLAPAFQATRVNLTDALKAGARGTIGGRQRARIGNALVVIEVALALVLLIGAGLLLQSFARLGSAQSGFETERLLTARVTLPPAAYANPEKIAQFYDQLMTRLRVIPGVRSASTIFPLPMSGGITTTSFFLSSHSVPENERPSELARLAGADYFQTMGVALIRGRFFNDGDRLDSKQVVVINERFARKYFADQDPVGQQMQPAWQVSNQSPQMREIVGVVANTKAFSLREDFQPEMYVPVAQVPYPVATILLRGETSNPAALADSLRAQLADVDPGLPLTAVRTFAEYRDTSLAGARFTALLVSLFAGVALLLTTVGIYGVIAYSVSQRTSEIGVRMALGALPSSIFRLVVGQGMALVAISIGIGLVGALVCTRLLGSLLYAVSAWDSLTFVSIITLIAGVAFCACWLPARRASKLDPIVALRME